MDNQFEPLSSGEVLSVDESAQILIGHRTFRVGEFAEAIRMQLEYGLGGWTQEKDAWFSQEGIHCEVLRFSSQGWQKGKVRINLEFCPYEPGDEDAEVEDASVRWDDDESAVLVDLEEEDEFELEDSSTSMEDELDLEESFSSLDDDEFELSTSEVIYVQGESEDPNAIYGEMEEETTTFEEEETYKLDISTSLDDEFDEISQSIEEELEMTESSTSGHDELVDLGEISIENEDEDDLDFGEIPASSEDEFQFEDFSSNTELDDSETDALLEDVWQDMNQSSWQNNQ